MHNLKDIRNNFEDFKKKIKSRNVDFNLDEIIDLDQQNRDLIHKKETGFVIENQDQLKKKMLELFEDSEKLLMYSKNAEGLMRNHWNYKLYEESLQKAINRVCEGQ